MQLAYAQAGAFGEHVNVAPAVSAEMSQVTVDGTAQRRKGRQQQHDSSAGYENGGHRFDGVPIVFHVLQNVQTDARVGTVPS